MRTDGFVARDARFYNACWFALVLWQHLQRRYLPGEWYDYWSYADSSLTKMQIVWDLWKDPRLSQSERVTFLATFDRALVRRSELLETARCFREVSADLGRESHFAPMADRLEELFRDETVLCVCWYPHSVAEDLWWVEAEADEEEGRPYNIDTDEGHFWVWDLLETKR